MKDILLINGYRSDRPFLPAGVGYVAQAIENAGFDYLVCDVNLQGDEEITRIVRDCRPRYVGLGTMTYQVERNYELLQAIRELAPETVIVLGGPHAIAAQHEVFHECGCIDFVVQGEGEEAIVKLLQGVPGEAVAGVLARDAADAAVSPRMLDLDTVAFPRYARFDLGSYGDTMYLASSRGCVYDCSFCGAPRFLGRKWRAVDAGRMIEEFEYWYRRGYRKFYFSDSLFALDRKRVTDFCGHVVASGRHDVEFTADGLRADHLTPEVLQQMKAANFGLIILGVESVNDATLQFFQKGQSFSQVDQAVAVADALGLQIGIYFVIGAPVEGYREALQSIRYPRKYKNIRLSIVSKLVPIKGTAYYEYALEHGLVLSDGYYPVHEVYGKNERQDTRNPVEEIWERLLPEIESMSSFLSMRNELRIRLKRLGVRDPGVGTLNRLTDLLLNPAVFAVATAPFRVARSISARWKTLLGR